MVLNAGVTPLGRALRDHTWEEANVKQAFSWVRDALPLALRTIVVSVNRAM